MKEEDTGAQFNSGLQQAMEIRKLLNECNYFSRMGSLKKWWDTLLCLEREIQPEMKEGDDKTAKIIKKDVIRLQRAYSFNEETAPDLYSRIHYFEIELRKIMKIRGLGMPDKEDDDGL